jgi:hypothetical protein
MTTLIVEHETALRGLAPGDAGAAALREIAEISSRKSVMAPTNDLRLSLLAKLAHIHKLAAPRAPEEG